MVRNTLQGVLRHLRKLCEASPDRDLGDGELLERSLGGGEEAAFAVLVQRHGPMVLEVCRRVLGDRHDAEDAFQATFLVLVRRSASIRRRAALGSWLFGVAQRVALRQRAREAARRGREMRAAERPRAATPDERTWQELRSALDEEIGSLPEGYRAPVVLCYLEGKSYEQAARDLGWPKSSLASRLARAREVLRGRLTRRGITLSAVALAAALAERAPAAALPARLTLSTVKGAVRFAARRPDAAGAPPPRAVALAEGHLKTTSGLKRKALALLLAVGLAAAGAGLGGGHEAPGEKPPPAPPAGAAAGERPSPPKPPVAAESFTYAGRVLDAEGRPLAGAKLLIHGLTPGVVNFRARAVSGPDGRFCFTVRRDEFGERGVVPPSRSPPERFVHVAATADGHGAACVSAAKPDERENLLLWLPAEEVVRGRVVDLEGKGVAGVSVAAYIRSARSASDHRPLPYDAPDKAGSFGGNLLPFENTYADTDTEGRFVLRGLSRGWLYDLSFHGPTVVNAQAQFVARPQKQSVVGATGLVPPNRPRPQVPLYGSTFTHVAVPCKPILGVVRDKGTGKPLVGVTVRRPFTRDDDPQGSADTDKDGRYRLTGLPRGTHTLRVEPPAGMPYLMTEVQVSADEPGITPVTFDIELSRQPTVRGRVTDRATGKPVAAWVEYRPLARNPNLQANPLLAQPRFRSHPPSAGADRDGRWELAVLPGPGVLLIHAEGDYLPARLEKADRVPGVADKEDPELLDCRPLLAWPGDFHAYRLIDARGEEVRIDLTLTPGLTRPLVVESPDGKERDVTVLGLKPVAGDYGATYYPGKSSVGGLAADEARRLFLASRDGQFAAALTVRGQERGPVRVKLRPTGTITGRLVGRDGRPLRGVWFQTLYDDGPGRPGVFVHGGYAARAPTEAESRRGWRTKGYLDHGLGVSRSERTDADGRFRLSGIAPDVPFDLVARLVGPPDKKGQQLLTAEVRITRPTVKPGETLDLGDLRAVAPPKK
jgi:RNA polymerase sigma factor (sigma-70 family)